MPALSLEYLPSCLTFFICTHVYFPHWLLLTFSLYHWFWVIWNVPLCSFWCVCFFFLGSLSCLDLWVYSVHHIWETSRHYFIKYFFLTPSRGIQLHIHHTVYSCPTDHWNSFIIIVLLLFYSLFYLSLSLHGFYFSVFNLVLNFSCVISKLLSIPFSVFLSETL